MRDFAEKKVTRKMTQQRKQSLVWSDKLNAANDDISRIQIKTGQLVTNPKSSAVGQITVW